MKLTRKGFILLMAGSTTLSEHVDLLEAANAATPPPDGDVVQLSFLPHGKATLSESTLVSERGDSKTYRKALNQHLSAWFEVRGQDVLAWVENSTTKVPGITSYDGTLELTVNGIARASTAITLCPRQRCAAALPQRISGGEAPITARNIDPALVPRYDVPIKESVLAASVAKYTPLGQGLYPSAVGQTGYHPSKGVVPSWDAVYLATKDRRALRQCVIMALQGGRFATHWRDDTTFELLSFEKNPTLSANTSSKYINGQPDMVAKPAGGSSAPQFFVSHHPSIGYVAYLATGWQYFRDEICFVAVNNHFQQSDIQRLGSKGILQTDAGSNTTRGAAWAFRTLAQASVVAGGQYATALQNNVDFYHAKYVAQSSCPQGWFQSYGSYETTTPYTVAAPWMDDYFGGALGFALTALPNVPRLKEVFAYHARSVVFRLGELGDPTQFAYTQAGNYTLPYTPTKTTDWATGKGPWFANGGEVFKAAFGIENKDVAAVKALAQSGYYPEVTSYWGELLPGLAYAVKFGVAGAAEGLARLQQLPGWFDKFLPGFGSDPVMGITLGVIPLSLLPPPTRSHGPAWRRGQAVNEVREIAGSSLRHANIVTPNLGNTGPASVINAENGLAVDSAGGKMFSAAAGGHADFAGNGVYMLDLMRDDGFWSVLDPGTPSTQVKNLTPPGKDGRVYDESFYGQDPKKRPVSRHTYQGTHYYKNRLVVVGGYSYSTPNGNTWEPRIFDMATKEWLPPGTWKGIGPFDTQGVAPMATTGDIYIGVGGKSQLWKYRSAELDGVLVSSDATVLNGLFPYTEATMVFDPVLNMLVMVTTQQPVWGGMRFAANTYDIRNGKATPIKINDSAALATFKTLSTGHGTLIYDSDLDCFYSYIGYASAMRLFKIVKTTPTAWDMSELARTGAALPPGSAARSLPSDNILTRAAYVSALRSVVFVPDYNLNVFVWRTS